MTWLPYTACTRCGQEFALDGPDHLCHDLIRAASQTSTEVDDLPDAPLSAPSAHSPADDGGRP